MPRARHVKSPLPPPPRISLSDNLLSLRFTVNPKSSSMPKKRFTNQYSKPPSTVHPSLNSTAASSSSSNREHTPAPFIAPLPSFIAPNIVLQETDAPPSVNELIASLRRANVSFTTAAAPATVVTPTLPPQIRQLLSQPETPTPRPRDRRQRYDAAGHRLPPGPAPPRSWLESCHAPAALRKRERIAGRLFPYEIAALPGISDQNGGRRLQDMCLRAMAKDWEFIREYEKNNLAGLPTSVRTLLLSYIAVYGPEDGVGAEGLNDILVLPNHEEDAVYDVGGNNEGFFRLDLSGSVGRSVSFRQLIEVSDLATKWKTSYTLISPPLGVDRMLTRSFTARTEARNAAARRGGKCRNIMGGRFCSIFRPNDPLPDTFVTLSSAFNCFLAATSYLFKACPYTYSFISRLLAGSFPYAERQNSGYGFAIWEGCTIRRGKLLLAYSGR